MPAIAAAVEAFALWVSPTGTFRLLDWGSVPTPEHALACNVAEPLGLTPELTMWTDCEAVQLLHPRNAHVWALLLDYRPRPGVYFGDAVFTGATVPGTGTVHGLTEAQALKLLDVHLRRINAHVPGARRH
ncbi:DUF3846 domain-containing protein [Streptomyces sp. NPDC054975]